MKRETLKKKKKPDLKLTNLLLPKLLVHCQHGNVASIGAALVAREAPYNCAHALSVAHGLCVGMRNVFKEKKKEEKKKKGETKGRQGFLRTVR